jgi:hypothetical protein
MARAPRDESDFPDNRCMLSEDRQLGGTSAKRNFSG